MTSDLDRVATPALLLDLDRVEANVERMAQRCDRLGVRLRPHFKTHKCADVAGLQVARSRAGGTVATLEEARHFAAHGITDLTWAFPVILGRLEEVRRLASEATLRVVVDSREALAALEALGVPLHVWIKVDCGYHRAGIDPAGNEVLELARRATDDALLQFDGLLTHSGHAYAARSADELRGIAESERDVMVRCAERLRAAGIPVPTVSVGSTPAMSAVPHLEGVDEARPGNYVFYDYTQARLGSCRVVDCAVTVLTSVVSRSAGHAVVDAGALALSKDPGPRSPATATWGEIFDDYETGRLHSTLRLTELSQEHGKLSRPRPVGERLRVLPNHSCLTVAQFDHFHVVRGDRVIGRWSIHRAR